jgi:hypothetical protein
MPFPPSVRDSALLAAARHCCVCRRYKGALLEVHHITPEAEGGTSDFENAIALCFDCHAWAGHYFAKHPKGSKYSPSHLRAAKKQWHLKVEAGDVLSPTGELSFQARYLISRDVDISRRTLAGELTVAPMPNTLLANNDLGRFITKILALYVEGPTRFFGDNFNSIEAYRAVHPEANCSRRDYEGYAYYDCVRKCTDQEFNSRIGSIDRFNKFLMEMGASTNELCVAVADNGDCGDGTVSEEYLTRLPWVVFLALTNITSRPIVIEQITGQRDLSDKFRLLDTAKAPSDISMPKCEISANQSVLIPLSLLLGPIQEVGESQVNIKTLANHGEFSEVMNLTSFPESGTSSLRVVGPSFVPQIISSNASGSREYQEIHSLDMASVYTIDHVWQCGSCPHLFVITDGGALLYVGELLAKGQCVQVSESIILPADISRLLIAELEDEASYLSEISLDGHIVVRDVELNKGDCLELDAAGAIMLSLTGAYFPLTTELDFNHSGLARNRLVCNFMATWQSDTTLPLKIYRAL